MMMQKSSRSFEILLVEDNSGDIRLTLEILNETSLHSNLSIAKDGEEATAFLRREGTYIDAPRPDLILLDLNMPRKDGREVLSEIKQDPDLKSIPVVILTTSDTDEDIDKIYNLHANCYITKPVELDQFVRIIKSIEDFWLSVVKLPPTTL